MDSKRNVKRGILYVLSMPQKKKIYIYIVVQMKSQYSYFQQTGGVLCSVTKCPCTTARNHSVVVDLGASLYVETVKIISLHPPQKYSANFKIYVSFIDSIGYFVKPR